MENYQITQVDENNIICFISKEQIENVGLCVDDFLSYSDKAGKFVSSVVPHIIEKYFSTADTFSVAVRMSDSGSIALDIKRTVIIGGKQKDSTKKQEVSVKKEKVNTYSFLSLRRLSQLCKVLKPRYHGVSSIFKDRNGNYCLYLPNVQECRLNNVIVEYCSFQDMNYSSDVRLAFLKEHNMFLIENNAIEALSM